MIHIFQSTRLKLTAWYLTIIMVICLLFSLAIYTGVNNEFRRFERFQFREQVLQDQRLPEHPASPDASRPRPNSIMIAQARMRVILTLAIINAAILIVAGLAAYFLAGKTLKPIRDMVEEQKRFITDASHELRTPLTSLRSEMEVNLLDKNLTLQDARSLIESNLEEVLDLQILSDRLLELAQYDKVIPAKSFTTVSLSAIITEAIKKVQGLAKKKKISIQNKSTDLKVLGDKGMLRELFTILLDNAIKYSDAKSKIVIKSEMKEHSAVISVSDKGFGIQDKDIPHLFNRFYRVDESRSKQVRGFGLGLSIAKKIVTLHNGTISVKSKLRQGTTFIVMFPLKA